MPPSEDRHGADQAGTAMRAAFTFPKKDVRPETALSRKPVACITVEKSPMVRTAAASSHVPRSEKERQITDSTSAAGSPDVSAMIAVAVNITISRRTPRIERKRSVPNARMTPAATNAFTS